MKNHYIFRSPNNGHFNLYQPFVSDIIFDPVKVLSELLLEPASTRIGSNFGAFVEIMEQKQNKWGWFKCPCCEKEIYELKESELKGFMRVTATLGFTWIMLVGVSGNY